MGITVLYVLSILQEPYQTSTSSLINEYNCSAPLLFQNQRFREDTALHH